MHTIYFARGQRLAAAVRASNAVEIASIFNDASKIQNGRQGHNARVSQLQAMAALARAVRVLSQSGRLRTVTTQPVHALSTLSRSHTLSTAAAAIDEDAEWSVAFKDATDAFSGEDSHETSAQRMRELVKSGLLRHTDLRDRPDRFFEAHRLLARRAVSEGPGFWIRFTVHYNLCYGTVSPALISANLRRR